jgi:hypothetical protein
MSCRRQFYRDFETGLDVARADVPAMQLHRAAGDGETEVDTAGAAFAIGVDAIERGEEVRQHRLRHAGPAIANGDAPPDSRTSTIVAGGA